MPYEVLARKWRPQVFGDVIGQEHVTQTLINAIQSGRLAHAYLFGGPRGVGKTSVARILAKAINCEQGEPGIPCNGCPSCLEITDGSSMDVQEIDGASNRGIDEIRELRDNIKYMPSSGRHRVYIIDEVHMLTLQAFNALLKTLEEPPAHVKFVFATTEAHRVPVTILSRCQRFDFKRIPIAHIVSQLEKIAEDEDIEISNSGLALIAREADGSMRDAESLLDQVISFTGRNVQDENITEILGVIDRKIIFRASRAIIEGSPKDCLEIVDQIYNYGYDIKEFYRALMDQFRDLLISLIMPQSHLLEMSEDEKEETKCLAEVAGSEKLQVLLNLMITREGDLRFTSHPRLILETIMVKLCHLGDFLSFGDLIRKIESLEKRLVTTLANPEQPKEHYLSDPGKSWVSGHQDKVQGDPEEMPESGQTWHDFLAFLSSRNKAMFNILKDWHLQTLSEKTIEIVKGYQSFSSTYFDDPERYEQLSEYCRDFFHRDIRVKILNNNKPLSPSKLSSKGDDTEPDTKKHTELPQPIQDVLHMFQGEIMKEHPTNKGGRHSARSAKKKEEVKK
ncbi:MAG: DNA polymerase III subunit gamma/tau [Desulfobacteraceae bacterium]|nr:DNA polymerase III subunit gamma/tau [Desulfobacteraceae bacterium]